MIRLIFRLIWTRRIIYVGLADLPLEVLLAEVTRRVSAPAFSRTVPPPLRRERLS